MKILVTNDDGVHAPGLAALAEALRPLGEVTTIAPASEMSATSHALTLTRPLRATRLAERTWAVDGTPTDCVYLAIYELVGRDVDLVVSGINWGINLGDDITYSGTVAAALEGTLLRCKSFAISQERSQPMHYARAAAFAATLARRILDEGLPPEVYLNVNVPAREIRGVVLARQGKRIYHDGVSKEEDGDGTTVYRIGGYPEWDLQPGSDITAFREGNITITPLRIDLTDEAAIAGVAGWKLPVPEGEPPAVEDVTPPSGRRR